MSDLNHQSQIRFDHRFTGFSVASLDPSGEFNLLLRCQELYLADLAQIQLDGCVAIVGRAFSYLSGWSQIRIESRDSSLG